MKNQTTNSEDGFWIMITEELNPEDTKNKQKKQPQAPPKDDAYGFFPDASF